MQHDAEDLDGQQVLAEALTNALWPGETIEEAALALAEEAGEVARAVIKRNHASRSEGDRPPTDWTHNLRVELAQVVVVALKMAEREGFSLWDAIDEQLHVLHDRLDAVQPEREATMIYLDGSKTSFRCQCGANVFIASGADGPFACNGCGAEYHCQQALA